MHWCVCATILRILSYASAFICQTNNIFDDEESKTVFLTANLASAIKVVSVFCFFDGPFSSSLFQQTLVKPENEDCLFAYELMW